MRKVFVIAVGLAMVALAATRAQATPIGQITTSDGLVFTLSDDGLAASDLNSADLTFDTEQFTLSLDSSGYTASSSDLFSSLALKLVNGSFDAEQLQSAPTLSSGDSWSDMTGGLNNGACDGSGAGFFCTDVRNGSTFDATGGVALDGSTYMWTWWVDPGSGGFNLPGDIKAQWFTSSGHKINQISTPFGTPGSPLPPPVPEPTTLLLLSSGLAGVIGSKLRRRSL